MFDKYQRANQYNKQTALKFLHYLQSTKPYLTKQTDEYKALHYLRSLHSAVCNDIKCSSQPWRTHKDLQAIASSMELISMGGFGKSIAT